MSAQRSGGTGSSAKRGTGGAKGTKNAKRSPQTRPVNAGTHASRPAEPRVQPRSSAIDRDTRNDLIGVALAALAVVLLIVVCMPGDAIVTSWLSRVLLLGLGLGAYILPFALFVWAVSFFLEDTLEIHIGRGAVGVLMIFIAVLSILSVNTPGAALDPSQLFVTENLVAAGGYLGAGIAWVALRFFGPVVAIVFLVALIVGGLVVIGLSISRLFARIVAFFTRMGEEREEHANEDGADLDAGPYARARMQRFQPPEDSSRQAAATTALQDEASDVTQVLASESANRTAFLGLQDDIDVDDGEDVSDGSAQARARFSPLVSAREIAASVEGKRGAQAFPRRASNPSRRSLSQRLGALGDDRARTLEEGVPFDGDGRARETVRLSTGDDIERAAADVGGRNVGSQDESTGSMQGMMGDGAGSDAMPGHSASANGYRASGKARKGVCGDVGAQSSDSGQGDAGTGEADAASDGTAPSTVPATAVAGTAAAAGLRAAGAKRRKRPADSSRASTKSGISARGTKDAAEDDSPVARALADTFGRDKFADYRIPEKSLLKKSAAQGNSRATQLELRECAERLQNALSEFKVDATVVGWIHGPTVTAFKIELAPGVRINTLTRLSADIALSLAASAVRIMSIPGTSLVGIEVPNQTRNNVLLGDVIGVADDEAKAPLTMGIGKNVEGERVTADLAEMPHLLIGGTTGSGKSVAINAMIMSILMHSSPSEVRMILIDPKRVELSLYNDIPNLYVPVVTDAEKAASALAWATVEMDRRLKLFEKLGVRNIKQYKRLREDKLEEYTRAAEKAEERAHKAGADEEGVEAAIAEVMPDEDGALKSLPYIVIVIDELADLMMVASKDVETSISRLAAVARAAGICLIIATQRPSTNIITGVIKANITNRIAFNVASGTDSRVILDSVGAEKLIGNGDMLFSRPEYGKPVRVQGCFVSEKEIKQVVGAMKEQGEPEYHEEVFSTRVAGGSGVAVSEDDYSNDDPLIWDAAEIVVSGGMGSTSSLQRRLSVGYARAGRIMDALENKGIVGPPNGSKPREVLVDVLELEGIKALEQNDG